MRPLGETRPVTTSPIALPDLAAEEPRGQYGVRLLDEPGNRQRAAREQDHDHTLARSTNALEDSLGEIPLLSGQAQMRAARRLSAHGRSLSQAKNGRIGRRAQIECRGNARHILALDRDTRRMQHLRVREAGAQARDDAHMTVRTGGSPPRPAHLRRRIRQRAYDGEPPRRPRERQGIPVILQQDDGAGAHVRARSGGDEVEPRQIREPCRGDKDRRKGPVAP